MTSATESLDLHDLLGDEPFVRGLAKSLLFDEHQVDDVVQQTWVEALSAARVSRSWLATVVRSRASNVRRSHVRTSARERAAARVEALPSTAELLEREELRRKVVEAVGSLPERYRVVVLLRFYEGLPPRKIAAGLELPRDTVATRLKRGIAMLRERLDADFGGDRRAWCLGLVPLAAPPHAGVVGALVAKLGASVGVILAMKHMILVLLGVVALALGFAASRAWFASPAPEPVVPIAGAPDAGAGMVVEETPLERGEVAPPARSEVAARPRGDLHFASVQAALCGFRGRVVGPDGAPASGEIVRLLGLDPVHALGSVFDPDGLGAGVLDAGTTVVEAQTRADGTFVIENVRPDALYALHAGVDGAHPTWLLLERTAGPGELVDLGTVALVAKGEVSGRVLDEDGEPIAGARVLAADVPGGLLSIAPVDRIDPRGGLMLAIPGVQVDGGPDLLERYHGRLRSHLAKRVTVSTDSTEFVALDTPGWFHRVWDELPVARATTDRDGRFSLRGVQPGSGVLVVRADGYARGMKPRVLVRAQDRRDVGDVVLRRGETCAGVVLDAHGEPMRAELRLASRPPIGLTGMLFAGESLRVGADGRFQASGLPREDLFIAARRANGHPWVVHGPFEADDEEIELRFEPLCDVVLEIGSTAQLPIDDVRVAVRRGPPLGELTVAGLQPELPVEREVDGSRAVVRGLDPGVYTIQVSAAGHTVALQLVDVAAGDEQLEPVPVSLTPIALARVQVVDGGGQPIEGAQVFAQSAEGPPGWARSVLFGFGAIRPWDELARFAGFTAADGTLAVAALPAGAAKLSARHPAYGTGWAAATLPGDAVQIVLQRCGAVHGRLHDGGRPASPDEYRLVAEPDSDAPIPGIGGQARLAADGSYRFDGLPAGRYEIRVEDSLSAVHSLGALIDNLEVGIRWFDETSRRVDVTVEPGGEHEVVFDVDEDVAVPGAGGRIELTLVIDGRPAVGYRVCKSWWPRTELGVTDARGRFVSSELVAQTYDVQILAPEGQNGVWGGQLTVTPGGTASERIELRYAEVIGRVVRGNGLAAVGHRVSVTVELAAGGGAGTMVTTDADGRYAARVPAGEASVWVEGIGGTARAEGFPLAAGGREVRDVVLGSDGVFSGRIVGSEQQTFSWIQLAREGTTSIYQVGEDRTFSIVRLRPGTYQVTFLDEDFRAYRATPGELVFDGTGMLDQVIRIGEPIAR